MNLKTAAAMVSASVLSIIAIGIIATNSQQPGETSETYPVGPILNGDDLDKIDQTIEEARMKVACDEGSVAACAWLVANR